MKSQKELRKKYGYSGSFLLDQDGTSMVQFRECASFKSLIASKRQSFTTEATEETRVRSLISQLDYGTLVRHSVIPDIFKEVPIKRYPPWIYSLAKTHPDTFSDFGLFTEELVNLALVGEAK